MPDQTFSFSYDLDATMEGLYTYEVIAWADEVGWGRMNSSLVGGTITGEVCNVPPDCSTAEPSVSIIWPPNHEFVAVTILGVTDPDGDAVSITIDSIMQDEPVDWELHTVGDGNFAPDGKGVGTYTALVRAERAGTPKVPGDGRVYHITFTASDGKGGTCSGEVKVGVPHDVKDTPVDGGALYNSVAP